MASKLVNHSFVNRSMEPQRLPSAEDLRRAFEAAVCELHHADRAAQKGALYYMPIVPRRKLRGDSEAGAEKRALSDAARALARLWKV